MLKKLWPFLARYKLRIAVALTCLILAKVANVGVPLILKGIVDYFNASGPGSLAIPLGLLVAYGVLRFASTGFGELRDAVFAKVTQSSIRLVALAVFEHIHTLSLSYHLGRQTGALSRDIDRGSKGINFLLNFTLFNVLPTLVEIAMVSVVLLKQYRPVYVLVTLGTILTYISFTLWLTEWRMVLRRTMNDMDSRASARAVDALLNFETVKYFGNEGFETQRYNDGLKVWETAAVKNQLSLAMLNAGQSLIIAVGATLLMVLAALDVAAGRMTVGDLVLVNAFLIQLYAPLHFLGFVYREIKHSIADMDRMFHLLAEARDIQDQPDALSLSLSSAPSIEFDRVDFAYDPARPILRGVSFSVPAGQTVAVVGLSGSGKSTLVRLLFRFYEVGAGAIRINGHDVRALTQASLRQHIGIVPQDTVLFNDTIAYNIRYGQTDASAEQVQAAARAAHIDQFIASLPAGMDTMVGERGLKLSGGEKQRVAIARTLLKNPPILVFDEATSALDSQTEKSIQTELESIARARTTLVIAHRLSTVVNADQIVVLEHGQVVEQGNHATLLAQGGRYAELWQLQHREHLADAETPS